MPALVLIIVVLYVAVELNALLIYSSLLLRGLVIIIYTVILSPIILRSFSIRHTL